ncbi:MAG: hypothetical protein UMU76_07785 [Prosthecochloris sp.]|nr:hypothetical protein [Prosthecochloris sp.]
MKKQLLSRYASLPDGRLVIDVVLDRPDDLFERFEAGAPRHTRDLAENLATYLLDCVREIGSGGFVVRFTFEEPPCPELRRTISQAVAGYFQYRIGLERSGFRRTVRASLLLAVLGIALLALNILLRPLLPEAPDLPLNLLYEGVMIAAWIALWEAVSLFSAGWFSRRRFLRACSRLVSASLLFSGAERES